MTKRLFPLISIILSISIICFTISIIVRATDTDNDNYIKWAEFKVPENALNLALKADIDSQNKEYKVEFATLLGILGAKYYGEWSRFKESDLSDIVKKIEDGVSIEEITKNLNKFDYFNEVYHVVLGGLVGEYQLGKEVDVYGKPIMETKYGLKCYSPIAYGYSFSHYKDFGSSRSFGYQRRHLGNDLMAQVGTPIVAVESGIVTNCGWNKYGGWRLGIRSFDGLRYYYYAHLRKDHPFAEDVKEGVVVTAGQPIGYVGMTGYSNDENVNGMKTPHLHFGLQLIFHPSQEEGSKEIWVDVYELVNFLEHHKSVLQKSETTKDYLRKYPFYDPTVEEYNALNSR